MSSRGEAASLAVVAKGDGDARPAADAAAPGGRAGGANAGAAAVVASADSLDAEGFSTVRDVFGGPSQNTLLELDARGSASRYDVTRGLIDAAAEVCV